MLLSSGDLRWGFSTRPTPYGEALPVLLWLDNETGAPEGVASCSGIEFFWAEGIEIFDIAGHRVLSRSEIKDRTTGQSSFPVFSCARNVRIEVSANSCRHTSFSQKDYDFWMNLALLYDLPPGRYWLVPSKDRGRHLPALPPEEGLAIIVEER
jgi:hypothetical protein